MTLMFRQLMPLAFVGLASCGGTIVEPTIYSAGVTGTITSIGGSPVAGLKVVSMIFTVGCDAGGGIQGGDSGTANESGAFSIFARGYTGEARCIGIRVEKDGVVIGSAAGRVSQFHSTPPFDTQVIDVVVP